MELIMTIIRGLISGFIWGYAGYKFIQTQKPNKDEVKVAAVLFTIAGWLNIIFTVIAFLILVSDKFNMKFFMKTPEVIEKEQNMSPEELKKYRKKAVVKKSLKYYVIVGVVVTVISFCIGVLLGIQEILYKQNIQNYQTTPPAPVYMEL